MQQVEFYLSEANLNRDSFFRQQSQKRSDGGVPLALLLKCHRLQSAGATEEILVQAVNESHLLRISDDGQAVVRIAPLVDLAPRDERTVLIVGIPRWHQSPDQLVNQSSDHPAGTEPEVKDHFSDSARWQMIDQLRTIFSNFGDVLYISVPCFHTSGWFRGFAFVEFSTPKEAKRAVKRMQSNWEHENWFIRPDPFAIDSCPDNAWKPRLAAKASFSPSDMVARRHIWRCCARKNKQISTAFRQLRAAGYRAPNPCDREYELITLGASNPEARSKHKAEIYGELDRSKLRVFRYSKWLFWRAKFYEWLNAWIVRMRRKTDELSIEHQPPDDEDTLPSSNLDGVGSQLIGVCSQFANGNASHSDTGRCTRDELSTAPQLHLPKNVVPNTVILLLAPSDLIERIDKPSDTSLRPTRTLSLARRNRIMLEQHILSPSNLLQEVAHIDPCPNPVILDEVFSVMQLAHSDSSTGSNPMFIRMKSAAAATALCQFVESKPSAGVLAHRLLGSSEETYFRAISCSLLGANERRRRAQLKRRQRKKQCIGNAVVTVDSPSFVPTPHKEHGSISSFSHGHTVPEVQHIHFDE